MSLNSKAVYKRNQRVKAQNRMWKLKQRENYFREHYRYTYVTQKKKFKSCLIKIGKNIFKIKKG